MFYLRSFVIGILLTLSYTCNGQVTCGWWNCLANARCNWVAQNSWYCECNNGYRLNADEICVDKNECSNFNICGPNKRCINTIGSYQCECYQGFMLINNQCTDINECSQRDFCGSPSAGECHNRVGSYWCKCSTGYTWYNSKCRDDDECVTFERCGPSSTGHCVNTPGSYNCICRTGYNISSNGKCTDDDECSTPDLCGPSSAGQCVNIPGSYNCNCSTGYKLEANGGCADIDECQPSDPCDPNAQCANFPGGYNCICNTGFSGDGKNCTDIDECKKENAACTDNADCMNYPGGYNCSCSMGFLGDESSCTAVAPVPSSLADSPGVIAGIAVGGLLIVLAITLILVLVITRRKRNKHKSEEPSLSNPTIDQEPSYVNVRMSDVSSEGNHNGLDAGVVSGDVNVLNELYSNNLVKERKKQQRDWQENAYPDDDAVIYSNEEPQSASGYDTLWKPSASQENQHPIAFPDEETYNHLHHRSLALPNTAESSTGVSLYNHLYSGGNVPQTQVISQAGQGAVEGNDEYSLAV